MPREASEERRDRPLKTRQLRAFKKGVGAKIMPTHEGWKVHYFSVPDFEQEPGTPYDSLAAALSAVGDLLPRVNTEETRHKAQDLEELLWLQLADQVRSRQE